MLKIGPEGKYLLSDEALNHILIGDISERQERKNGKVVKLTPIIAGGVHTTEAAKKFLQKRTDIKHGLFFDPDKEGSWYYARELKNKVILLRLPREAFQTNAARLTQFPETYYKSGYLWKTLFPKHYTKTDIIRVIDEALHNQDKDETKGDLIIGYNKESDPFKVLKIRIQLQGVNIISAFPTWGQPMTGNNGKPFSHIDAINTIISASAIFLRDEDQTGHGLLGTLNEDILDELVSRTPQFMLKRPDFKPLNDRVQKRDVRETVLETSVANLTEQEIDAISRLISGDEFQRHTALFMNTVYARKWALINRYQKYKNAIALYQNFSEGLKVISKWDLLNGKKKAVPIIFRFLKTRFINTGGLDQWEIKRLSNVLFEIIYAYKDPEITLNFLLLLSGSPCRVGFYTELNMNIFFKTNLMFIGVNDYKEPLTQKHFFEYVAQNLGLNYTFNFGDDFNLSVAQRIQETAGAKVPQLNNDCISFAVANDFTLFIENLTKTCECLSINKESIEILDNILYDYHRCLAANILRVMVKHREIFMIHRDEYDFGTEEYNNYTKAMHEHRYLSVMNNLEIEKIEKLIIAAGFPKEAQEISDKYRLMMPEVMKIPMPKSVPSYAEVSGEKNL